MGVPQNHSHPMSGADEGDRRHGADHWSGRPNNVLIDEITGMVPGRAIDLGCGGGGDAIWLASQGWTVTGVDISQVAIDGAAKTARERDVDVDWICADFVDQPPTDGGFDLVTAFYPALLKSAEDDSVNALLVGVAEGGTLLVVGHGAGVSKTALSQGFDPGDYMEPEDIARHLDADWDIEVLGPTRQGSEGSPRNDDIVLKATRRGLPERHAT